MVLFYEPYYLTLYHVLFISVKYQVWLLNLKSEEDLYVPVLLLKFKTAKLEKLEN